MRLNKSNTQAGLSDLFGFLIGHRSSIWRLTHAKGSIALGGALVLSAAMAREYDATNLIDRPFELAGPFVVSFFLASGLFVWTLAGLRSLDIRIDHRDRFFAMFLAGYWLTAPLAWLYGIPIEIVANEVDSLRFNLTMLSVVSIWRIALFARVISVLFRLDYACSLALILVPCMAIAFIAMLSSMLNVVGIMSGARLSQSQQVIVNYQGIAIQILWWSFLPVVIATIALILLYRRRHGRAKRSHHWQASLSRLLYVVPAVAVMIFLIAMTHFQPQLRRAAQVDSLLTSRQVTAAITMLNERLETDWPRHWDPIPNEGDRGSTQLPIVLIAEALRADPPKAWVTNRLLSRADRMLLLQAGHRPIDFESPDEVEHVLRDSVEDLNKLSGDVKTILSVPSLDPQLQNDLQRLSKVVESSLEQSKQKQRAQTKPAD
ncbi:MAG: hypothetical protein AAF745_02145 [Planctomycetota bacterium]